MRRAQLWHQAERWSGRPRHNWHGLALGALGAVTYGALLARYPVWAFVFLGVGAVWARRGPSRNG